MTTVKRSNRLLRAGLALLALLGPLAASGQILNTQFEPTQVQRGAGTMTATITLRNHLGSAVTNYVTGYARPPGTGGDGYLFSPERRPVAMTAYAVTNFDLTWVPSVGVTTGSCYFACRVYKTSTGNDTWFTNGIPAAFEIIDPRPPELLDVFFDRATVARGYQTITASIAVLNPGAATTTCYVTGFARPPGTAGDGYPFAPERLAVTVNPGETNIVDLTWAPGAGITTGNCYFACRLYKTAIGTDTWDTNGVPAAFAVVDPYSLEVQDVSFDRATVARGYQTITASIAVLNSGAATTTCYVTGFGRPPGTAGDGYLFAPERLAVTVNPGETNIVDLTWAPGAGITTGDCYFACRLYKTDIGTDTWDTNGVPAAFAVVDPYSLEVQDVSFDRATVARGYQTITASIAVLNSGAATTTCYVTGFGRPPGTGGDGFPFSPERQSVTVNPGETNIVDLTWAPGAGITTGNCYFACRLYKTDIGTDTWDTNGVPAAFAVVDPYSLEVQDVSFDRATVARGYQTITASIAVLNSGAATTTCYVTGFGRPPGTAGDGYLFAPERLEVTVNPGETNIVDLTWAPGAGITTGDCYFACRLYKTDIGTDTWDTNGVPAAFAVVEPNTLAVLDVSFDRATVARGYQTITASIAVLNSGAATTTCYVTGFGRPPGTGGDGFPFSPERQSVMVEPGETNIINLTWAPGAGITTGACYFACRLYKTAIGTDTWDTNGIPDAFEVIEATAAGITAMTCSPEQLELGIGTITASVTVVNMGVDTFTFYAAGLAQTQGAAGFYFFTPYPDRLPVTLDAGQSTNIQMTWTPPGGTPLGAYNFICRLYKTPTGTDMYDEQVLESAFIFYDPLTARGTVTVTLTPAEAVAAGAQWRITWGAWRASGETATDQWTGYQYIEFKAVDGWVCPDPFWINLHPDENYQATNAYSTIDLTLQLQNGQMLVQWPGSVTGMQLESSPALGSSASWTSVPGVDMEAGAYLQVPTNTIDFYRLGPD
ncbi:MAG: hypothetical protein AB7T27_08495 [Kiritimatiellia bacterium]